MQNKICETKADTLKDLQTRIAYAINRLGEDALWSGYEDGCIYLWHKDNDVQLCINPAKKYSCETVRMEVTE
jgi:hypothetical protein